MRRFGMVSRLTASYSSLQLGRQSSHVAINQLRSPPGSERNESVMIWGRGVHAKRHESGMGACCFCCVLIVATNIDPCRLTVATVEGNWQVWFRHSSCFRERLSDRPELIGLFSPAHF